MRTFDPLTFDVLQEIRGCALCERDRFITQAGKQPGKFRSYATKLIAICLCQGAAQHFVDLQEPTDLDNTVFVPQDKIDEKGYQVLPSGRVISGVNDIDVCIFFEHDDGVQIRNVGHCIKTDRAAFPGLGERRVDFLKKGIRRQVIENAKSLERFEIIRSYVRNTPHGQQHLSRKSVVGLYPDEVFGHVLWRTLRLVSERVEGPCSVAHAVP
jgi:hypothetical protein